MCHRPLCCIWLLFAIVSAPHIAFADDDKTQENVKWHSHEFPTATPLTLSVDDDWDLIGDWTLEFWFEPTDPNWDTFTGDRTIVMQGDANGLDWSVFLYRDAENNALRLGLWDGEGNLTERRFHISTPLRPFGFFETKFHHVAIVIDETSAKVLQNGNQLGTLPGLRIGGKSSRVLTLGSHHDGSDRFQGYLAGFRFWGEALRSRTIDLYSDPSPRDVALSLSEHPYYDSLLAYSRFTGDHDLTGGSVARLEFPDGISGFWVDENAGGSLQPFDLTEDGKVQRVMLTTNPYFYIVSSGHNLQLYEDGRFIGFLNPNGDDKYQLYLAAQGDQLTPANAFQVEMVLKPIEVDGATRNIPHLTIKSIPPSIRLGGMESAEVYSLTLVRVSKVHRNEDPADIRNSENLDDSFNNGEAIKDHTALLAPYDISYMNHYNFKLGMPIQKKIFKQDNERPDRSIGFAVPVNMDLIWEAGGRSLETSTFTSTTNDFHEARSANVGFSIGVPLVGSFGANASFDSEINTMRKGETTTTVRTSEMRYFHATLNMQRVALDTEFRNTIHALMAASTNADAFHEGFETYFKNWGTHYSTGCTLGARELFTSLVTRTELEKGLKTAMNVSVNVSGSAGESAEGSGEGGGGIEESRSVKNVLEEGGWENHSVGAAPTNQDEPFQPDVHNLVPIALDLRPTYELLSPRFFDDPLVYLWLRYEMKRRMLERVEEELLDSEVDATEYPMVTIDMRAVEINHKNKDKILDGWFVAGQFQFVPPENVRGLPEGADPTEFKYTRISRNTQAEAGWKKLTGSHIDPVSFLVFAKDQETAKFSVGARFFDDPQVFLQAETDDDGGPSGFDVQSLAPFVVNGQKQEFISFRELVSGTQPGEWQTLTIDAGDLWELKFQYRWNHLGDSVVLPGTRYGSFEEARAEPPSYPDPGQTAALRGLQLEHYYPFDGHLLNYRRGSTTQGVLSGAVPMFHDDALMVFDESAILGDIPAPADQYRQFSIHIDFRPDSTQGRLLTSSQNWLTLSHRDHRVWLKVRGHGDFALTHRAVHANRWNKLVVSVDLDVKSVSTMLNGRMMPTRALPDTSIAGSPDDMAWRLVNAGDFGRGSIDELMFFSKALSPQEMYKLQSRPRRFREPLPRYEVIPRQSGDSVVLPDRVVQSGFREVPFEDSVTAYWPFDDFTTNDQGGRSAGPMRFLFGRNPTQLGELFTDQSLNCQGRRLQGAVRYLDFDQFAFHVNFLLDQPVSPILAGGDENSWLSLSTDATGHLWLRLRGVFSDQAWKLSEQPIPVNEWQQVVCTVDIPNRKVRATLGGVLVLDRSVDSEFELLPASQDFGDMRNRSFTISCAGKVDELIVYHGALSTTQLLELAARERKTDAVVTQPEFAPRTWGGTGNTPARFIGRASKDQWMQPIEGEVLMDARNGRQIQFRQTAPAAKIKLVEGGFVFTVPYTNLTAGDRTWLKEVAEWDIEAELQGGSAVTIRWVAPEESPFYNRQQTTPMGELNGRQAMLYGRKKVVASRRFDLATGTFVEQKRLVIDTDKFLVFHFADELTDGVLKAHFEREVSREEFSAEVKQRYQYYLDIEQVMAVLLREAVASREGETIERLARQLREEAGKIGEDRLAGDAAQLETIGKFNDLDRAGAAFDAMNNSLNDARARLTQIIDQ